MTIASASTGPEQVAQLPHAGAAIAQHVHVLVEEIPRALDAEHLRAPGDAVDFEEVGVVLGDAGDALGDSLYEARLFVRGAVKSLGADCIEKDMRQEHLDLLADLLARAGADARPEEFKRYGSARKLYNFNIDHADAY